jgi:hypothetical protein
MSREEFARAGAGGEVSDADANHFRMQRGDFSRVRGAEMSGLQFERAMGPPPPAGSLEDLIRGYGTPKVAGRIPIQDLNVAKEIPIEQGRDIPVSPYEKQNAPPSLRVREFRMLEELLGRPPTEQDIAEFMRGRESFKPPSDREQRLAGKPPTEKDLVDEFMRSKERFEKRPPPPEAQNLRDLVEGKKIDSKLIRPSDATLNDLRDFVKRHGFNALNDAGKEMYREFIDPGEV